MKITIHRGTNQIGGCVTEIESGGYKVFIDFGEQLPGSNNHDLDPIEGLSCGDVSKSALFITHYHGDHIGKISETVNELKIYAGESTKEIYKCLLERLSETRPDKYKNILSRIKEIRSFKEFDQITIGGITVTPLWADHSAFDAYMFIIEAQGKRILHTGDFRGHGFRSHELESMLKEYAQNIDYIITEGTNIQQPNVIMKTEMELQSEFESQFREIKYNFVLVSSTNIDRIFALYHAAKNAKRCFVCDNYQANIIKFVSQNHENPLYDIDYKQKTEQSGRFFTLSKEYNQPFTFDGKLKPYLERHGFVMIFRANNQFKTLVEKYSVTNDFKIYYTMWDGYLDSSEPAYSESMYKFLEPYQFKHVHTSGHADVQTLNTVFTIVKPKYGVIPIHTEAPERFRELFKDQKIILLKDGEKLDNNEN